MTFRESFYAEQLFLKKAKQVIESNLSDNMDEDQLVERTVAVLSCAFALEALANSLFIRTNCMLDYDDMSLKEKISVLGQFAGVNVDYSKKPWQHLSRLIKVRNWLVHYKQKEGGLIGSSGAYIKDSLNQIPKPGSLTALDNGSLLNYYNGVRKSMYKLADGFSLKDEYAFLKEEDYCPREFG